MSDGGWNVTSCFFLLGKLSMLLLVILFILPIECGSWNKSKIIIYFCCCLLCNCAVYVDNKVNWNCDVQFVVGGICMKISRGILNSMLNSQIPIYFREMFYWNTLNLFFLSLILSRRMGKIVHYSLKLFELNDIFYKSFFFSSFIKQFFLSISNIWNNFPFIFPFVTLIQFRIKYLWKYSSAEIFKWKIQVNSFHGLSKKNESNFTHLLKQFSEFLLVFFFHWRNALFL